MAKLRRIVKWRALTTGSQLSGACKEGKVNAFEIALALYLAVILGLTTYILWPRGVKFAVEFWSTHKNFRLMGMKLETVKGDDFQALTLSIWLWWGCVDVSLMIE
jgi:hypothetical protein